MPDSDLERLRESIRQNLEALDQILHRQAEQEPQERPQLRLIKGGMLGAALLSGVEWLRRHREVTVALVVAAVAAAAAWLMWPSNDLQPSVEPPARTSTVTVRVAPPPKTSVPPLPTPRTAAPTTVPTTVPTVTVRSPAPTTAPTATVTRTMQQTVPPTQPTTQPATLPTSPRRTTAPPTEPTRTTTPPRTTPSCLILVRVSAVVGVCVRL